MLESATLISPCGACRERIWHHAPQARVLLPARPEPLALPLSDLYSHPDPFPHWTTIHLCYEQEAADLLGIPYDESHAARAHPLRPYCRYRLPPRPPRAPGARHPLEPLVKRPP